MIGSETRAVAGHANGAVNRRQRVRVRRELLTGAEPARALRFNLFGDVGYDARIERSYTTEGGDRVYAGWLEGWEDSQFLLLVHGEETIADFFVSPLERYQLRREADGAMEVQRVDPRALPPCGGTAELAIPRRPRAPRTRVDGGGAGASAAATDPGVLMDDPGQFDVLIAYTPAARLRAGGSVGSIESQASFAVESANQRYRNSGINTRARLVRTMEVNYAETGGDLREDLRRLEIPDDGFLDEIHAARDLYQADLVSLFVNGPPPGTTGGFFVGRAPFALDYGEDGQLVGEPRGGFSVVVPSYDVANTFAHEVGHNFGCQHDRENATTFDGAQFAPGIFPFSFGWRFLGSDKRQYRDVMAYDPGTVIPYFSNPLILYAGTPTGVADYADNARTMNATAPIIANLRRLPLVSISAPVPRALENPSTPGRFTVSRSGPTDRSLMVSYSVDRVGNHATPGIDYQPLPSQIIIPAGQNRVDIDVVPIDNDQTQGLHYVTLHLLNGLGYRITGDNAVDQASVAIDDTLQTVSIITTQPAAQRNPLRIAHFLFTRTGPTDQPLTVTLFLVERIFDKTFTFWSNFQFYPPLFPFDPPPTRAVIIPAGSATLDLAFIPDQTPLQSPQVVSLVLQARDSYKPAIAEASVVVLNDVDTSAPPTELALVATNPIASAITGKPGQFLVTRTGRLDGQTVSVSLTGTAFLGLDYHIDASRAYFPNGLNTHSSFYMAPGQSSAVIDIIPEPNVAPSTQTVIATLSAFDSDPTSYAPDRRSAVVTLLGNASLVTATATSPEARVSSDLGPVNGEFTFTREGDLSRDLAVGYTVGGSAMGGVQYRALPGSVLIPAGSDSATVRVRPLNTATGKTRVKITLQAGEGYTLGGAIKAKVKVIGAE